MKLNKSEFEAKIRPIVEILEKKGTDINEEDYDGVVVKKITTTYCLWHGKTTHIEFGKEQMDIFPYLQSWGYFCENSNDENLKSYFILKIPIVLSFSNLFYLIETLKEDLTLDQEKFMEKYELDRDSKFLDELANGRNRIDDIKKSINFFTNFYNLSEDNLNNLYENKIYTYTTGLRNMRTDSGACAEISQLSYEEENFTYFRWLAPLNSHLILLKLKEQVKYEAFIIRQDDIVNWSDFEREFYYYLNNSYRNPNKTLVSLENFAELNLYEDDDREPNGENTLYYGVPGSGKSFQIKKYFNDKKISESQIQRIIFHPDYTYSDFIGQILPNVEKGISYKFSPGPFTLILEEAFHNPDKNYYLVIEEINRGNAPAIFGDIFQLLDRVNQNDTYPIGTSEYSIINSDIAGYVYNENELSYYGNKIRIPSNLSIIATMNTADQNVFTLDTAFQRRWNMKMIKNNWDDGKVKFPIRGINMNWDVFAKGMNKLIIEKNKHGLSSEDKRFGAYFIKKEDFNDSMNESETKKIFAEKVLKYLWDDAFKFHRDHIFEKDEDEPFTLEYFIDKFTNEKTEDKFSIFTDDARSYIGLDKKSKKGQEHDQ